MTDRVGRHLGRRLAEVPVGFKWFVDGLLTGGYGFGGEESAGASFLRRNGTTWTTDKDGFILDLLAAEMTAVIGRDPGEGGDLDRVARVLRLGGFVNCTAEFTDAPKCVNGASDLMVAVFGDAGRHARAAVGVASLPAGAAVEVDAIVELK